MKVSFFDTETTGLISDINHLNYDRVIELTIMQYEYNGAFSFIKEFDSLIKTDKKIPESLSRNVHGIWDSDLEDKKTFEERLDEILLFKNTEIWIGQNVFFDVNFLDLELTIAKKKKEDLFKEDCLICDTLTLKKVLGLKKGRQKDLFMYYFPDEPLYNAHRSRDDVEALKKIVEKALLKKDIGIEFKYDKS